MTGRLQQGQELYRLMQNEKWDETCRYILQNPDSPFIIGYETMSCSGGWGMPIYAHFAKLLDENDERYRQQQGAKDVAKAIDAAAKKLSDKKNTLLLKLALRGRWPEILQECIADTDIALKRSIETEFPIPDELQEVWSQWIYIVESNDNSKDCTETEKKKSKTSVEIEDSPQCVICMDALQNAYFSPCAHSEFCFTCLKDQKLCPLCRIEGYGKQK